MTIALELALLGVLFLLLCFEAEPQLSPDGSYYLGLRSAVTRPYVLRICFFQFLGRPKALMPWLFISWGSILGTAGLVYLSAGAGATALFLGLASTRTNFRFPILSDQFGIFLLTLSWYVGLPWGIPIAIAGALVNEKIPVFAALLLGSWAPLLGVPSSLLAYYLGRNPGLEDPEWLRNPVPHFLKGLKELSWYNLVLPWGAALPGILGQTPLLLAAAYAPCAIALDRARIYQWIGPMVCVSAVPWIPEFLWPVVLLVHLSNPWRKVI